MKLVDIIFKYDWDLLYKYFNKYYPFEKIEHYKDFLESLKKLTPIESEFKISINHIIEDHMFSEGIDDWYSVHGISKNTNSEIETYALEYSTFEEWLGMEIDEDTLNRYPKPFIIIHCLWEMTFCGFTNEQIQNRLNKIEGKIKCFK